MSKQKSLSSFDLMSLTNNQCNIFVYRELLKVKDIDDLFVNVNSPDVRSYLPCVLLYENEQNYGHWTCLIRVNDETIEHFDPYGFKTDSQLQFVSEYYSNFETAFPHLSKLLVNSDYTYVQTSNVQLQKIKDGVNTCGRWIATRINFWNNFGTGLYEFVDIFKQFNEPPSVRKKNKFVQNFLKRFRIKTKVRDADDLVTILTSDV